MLLALAATASCGGKASAIGDGCTMVGSSAECDPGEICAPRDQSTSTFYVCSIVCTKDADCGVEERCLNVMGTKACTSE